MSARSAISACCHIGKVRIIWRQRRPGSITGFGVHDRPFQQKGDDISDRFHARRRANARGGFTAAVLALLFSACGNTDSLLKEGETAPDVDGITADGTRLRIREYAGARILVLYFYPKDDTRGCTREACDFRDRYTAITDAGAAIVGVSADDTASHAEFAGKYRLPFPLIADTDHAIARAFGVPVTLGLMKRVTFVIDRQGIIRKTFPSVDLAVHAEEILAAVRSLR